MNKTVLLTDRYKVTQRRQLLLNMRGALPPEFIVFDCKLWQWKGGGLNAYFYHEVEDFQLIS